MKEASIGIIFCDDKVLLIERRDVPVWALPGGGIEEGESPEEALCREVQEETGLEVTSFRKVGLWLPINKIASPAHVFECQVAKLPEKFTPQEESKQIKLWSLDALPSHLFFLHRDWILAAIDKAAKPKIAMMTKLTYWNCLKLLLCHPIYTLRYLLSRLGLPINN